MPAVLFYLFAAMALFAGVSVVACRNPVASALSLVVSFAGLAALFISLDAYFIGIIQILVYAGAVMVLFLFILMLLDIKVEALRKINAPAIVGGGVLALVFIVQLCMVLGENPAGKQTLADLPVQYAKAADAQKLPGIKADLQNLTLPDSKLVGQALFQRYPLQIQLIGVLLLVGTIGVVVMSKREVN
jgi:NADH-quinone oxidoreductase subunit J